MQEKLHEDQAKNPEDRAKQIMQKMFDCVLIASMLFSKPSKKTQKNAEENAAPESANAQEVTKPRASRSSKSKSSESSETGSVKHRRPATKAPSAPGPAVSEVKTMAAAVGAEQSLPVTAPTVSAPVVSTERANAPSNTERAAAQRALSQEEVARLAYSYWVQRGYAPGSPEEDWLRAEQELKATL